MPSYSVGDSVSITCSTDLKVGKIVWLNANRQEVSVATGAVSLTLNFNSLMQSMNGAQFTCLTESEFGSQMLPITLEVVEESSTSDVSIGVIVGVVIGAFLLLLLIPAVITIWACKKPW